jgi:hypothetical protein
MKRVEAATDRVKTGAERSALVRPFDSRNLRWRESLSATFVVAE